MSPTLDLDTLTLAVGKHASPDKGFCVMEAVAYIAGERFTDSPACASSILGSFLRSWNDSLPDEQRQMLKPLIPRLVGTNTGKADEETRAWMLTDWLARECAPGFLRLAGLTDQAELLEQLAPLASAAAAKAAQPSLDTARAKSAAARDAAWDAAWAAAWDAAWAAAWAAARDAARDAAWAAARDAARAAARDAARDAAWAAARDAARDAAWDAAWAAAWDAAWAAARDAARAAARAAARDAARDAADKGGGYQAQYDAAKAAAQPLIEARFADTVKALQASAFLLVERMIEVSAVPAA